MKFLINPSPMWCNSYETGVCFWGQEGEGVRSHLALQCRLGANQQKGEDTVCFCSFSTSPLYISSFFSLFVVAMTFLLQINALQVISLSAIF